MAADGSTTASRPVPNRPARRAISVDGMVRAFFGSNALVAVVVLALITIFLFREGSGFFGQNLNNLRVYRQAGLELVDIIRAVPAEHVALSRELSQIRLREFRATDGQSPALPAFDAFAEQFSDIAGDMHGLVSDLGEQAVALRDVMRAEEGNATAPDVAPLRAGAETFDSIAAAQKAALETLLAAPPPPLTAKAARTALETWRGHVQEHLAGFPEVSRKIRAWDAAKPVAWYRTVTSFLFGRDWITASFWQDWYGILPLLAGSLTVSFIALVLAVPFGVASAVYVSEVAAPRERSLIKPYLEFIAAIPSVVLGFFGIVVVGEAIRRLSNLEMLDWVPFFPLSERLNAFTAGVLLALMAVPTIFTLSEDALRNVPRAFKEASYALGANRIQTIGRVTVPAALSGIVSAILLGFGRVIGETMVVLLCAGNRIEIPDFREGLGAFFQPVHTMTGIIAQEMGEVVQGSIHYRALFMVGMVLFLITLAINFLAQKLVARYRMSIG